MLFYGANRIPIRTVSRLPILTGCLIFFYEYLKKKTDLLDTLRVQVLLRNMGQYD